MKHTNSIQRLFTYIKAVYGNADAQYDVAEMISYSERPDAKESALKWYELAANQGHNKAAYDFAVYHIHQFNNTTKAIEILSNVKEVNSGDIPALLGQLLLNRYEHVIDHRKVTQQKTSFKKSEQKSEDEIEVDNYIKSLHLDSKPIILESVNLTDEELNQCLSDALKQIEIGKLFNHPLAYHNHAHYLLEHSDNSKENYAQAISFLQKSVDMRFAPSCQILAGIYENGLYGVKANVEYGLSLRIKAAEYGSKESQFILGVLVYQGQGFQKDKEKGLKLIEMAAKANHQEAQSFLKNLNKKDETISGNANT
jgi:TPR repeat protein